MKATWLALALSSLAWAQQPSVEDTLKRGLAALEAGRNAEAAQLCEQVVTRDYTNYSGHFCLGLALYRQADLKGARFEFTQLTLLAPNRFEGWFNLGVTLDRLGESAGAAQALAKAIEVGEKAGVAPADLRTAYLGLAKAQRDQRQYDQAAATLADALKKFENDQEVTFLLADSLYRANKPLEALPYLYTLLNQNRANVGAVSLVADIYVGQGLPERAVTELDRSIATAQDPKVKAQLVYKKSSLLSGKAQQDALAEAVRLDPKLWTAQYDLGRVRYQGGDFKGALEAFQAAYNQMPDEPRVVLALALTYDRLGQFAEAGRFAALAAKSSSAPEKAEALFVQGKAAYFQQRYDSAEEVLLQAVQLKADRGAAWFYLGRSQFALKKYEAAIASLERAQALEPTADTAANLGTAYLAANRYSDAERLLNQAVALNPRDAVAWYNLGLTLQALSRNAEARRAFQQALNLGYEPARQFLR
jgi:tetratricopeptide (TPR) repeat protein